MKQRNREQNVVNEKMTTTNSYYKNNVLQSTSSYLTDSTVSFDYMMDIVGNYGYVNPSTRSIFEFTTDSSSLTTSLSLDRYVCVGDVTTEQLKSSGTVIRSPGYPSDPSINDMIDIAKQYALSKIDSTPYAFGEDVAELMSTIDLLKAPLGPIRDLNKALKKDLRRISTPIALAKFLSSAWLTYRFAYGNLYMTADNALNAYARRGNVRPVRRVAVGTEKYNNNYSGELTITAASGAVHHFPNSRIRKYSVKAGIIYHDKNPLDTWRSDLGLRNKDLPITAWQVIPASWFVDKVLNLSNSIKGLTNYLDPNIQISDGWVTLTLAETSGIYYSNTTNSSWTRSGIGNRHAYTSKYIQRSPWMPGISDTIPTIELDIDFTEDWDATAFLVQRMLRKVF